MTPCAARRLGGTLTRACLDARAVPPRSERKTPRRGAVRGEEDGAEMVERVEKAVTFCPPSSTSGATVTRSVAQLSGGERMRVALCLSLGMMDLLRCVGRVRGVG